MMKTMKKLPALILCLALMISLFSLSVTAQEDGSGNLLGSVEDILQLRETEILLDASDRITVSIPLQNSTEQRFQGIVLAAAFLNDRFLGVDAAEVELQPGQVVEQALEIRLTQQLGRHERATVRFYLVDASLSPVAAAQETEAPNQEDMIYDSILGEYERLLEEALVPGMDTDERYVRMAKAEAALLDSGAILPSSTTGGSYAISRVAPHTAPYTLAGKDAERLSGLVISEDFLTKAERTELLAQWQRAAKGEGSYDPAAWLRERGHTLQTEYADTYSEAPASLDLSTTDNNPSSDTRILTQTVVGLVQYDAFNQLRPMLAESWEISDDALTYTFHIRPGVYWYTSAGEAYAELTAEDFVNGFRHMMDCRSGKQGLISLVVQGAGAYLYEGGSFDDVGCQATDRYTLTITLAQPCSYFMWIMSNNVFLPICSSFYEAHGGVYGLSEFDAVRGNENVYSYANPNDVSSQLYCGPFLLQKADYEAGEIVFVRNEQFFANDLTTLDRVTFYRTNDSASLYDEVLNGKYARMSLSGESLERAKEDGLFEQYVYIGETTSTTYFNNIVLDRGTYVLQNDAVASPQDETARESTHVAVRNKAFRQALQFAYDRAARAALQYGEDLKLSQLRNMLTPPDFVALSKAVTLDGMTFEAGTFYGEIVQHYLEQLGSPVRVDDQIDGWFYPEIARERLAQAKEELGSSVSWPIQLDIIYMISNVYTETTARAYKQSLEQTLGAENVQVNMIPASNYSEYYASFYNIPSGEYCNCDLISAGGWGPDYGDPNTYLNIFRSRHQGYLTKLLGLY